MRRILVTALATFGAMALLAAIGGALLLLGLRSGDDIPDRVILEFDFETDLVEYVPEDPLAQVMLGQVPTTRSIVEALERARDDDRVVALIARPWRVVRKNQPRPTVMMAAIRRLISV